jgi:hypothetical protein
MRGTGAISTTCATAERTRRASGPTLSDRDLRIEYGWEADSVSETEWGHSGDCSCGLCRAKRTEDKKGGPDPTQQQNGKKPERK